MRIETDGYAVLEKIATKQGNSAHVTNTALAWLRRARCTGMDSMNPSRRCGVEGRADEQPVLSSATAGPCASVEESRLSGGGFLTAPTRDGVPGPGGRRASALARLRPGTRSEARGCSRLWFVGPGLARRAALRAARATFGAVSLPLDRAAVPLAEARGRGGVLTQGARRPRRASGTSPARWPGLDHHTAFIGAEGADSGGVAECREARGWAPLPRESGEQRSGSRPAPLQQSGRTP